jgi:chromosome partitioning protein
LVSEMRTANPALKAYAFINRADPRGQDNDDEATVLKDNPALSFLDTPIGSRKAFANAAAEGLAVTELRTSDAKATDEIMALFRYVFDTINISERYQADMKARA